jgi:hypothetical protein
MLDDLHRSAIGEPLFEFALALLAWIVILEVAAALAL